MTETKKPRQTELHYLPAAYSGRCQGTEGKNYVNSFVSFGGNLPEGEVLHKFEMRLPIPQTKLPKKLDEELQELYNYSSDDFITKALAKVMTDVDESFKAILFKEVKDGDTVAYPACPGPMDVMEYYSEERHLAAQASLDSWRYTPRAAGGKTITVSAAIQRIIASGRVTADQLEGVETQADLFNKLSELGIL